MRFLAKGFMMADDLYERYRFSMTCETDDLAVVHCLRALCQYAEDAPRKQIGWGGTGEAAWRSAGNRVTFRWTSPENRERFRSAANRLLGDRWREISRSDNDPATRQRK